MPRTTIKTIKLKPLSKNKVAYVNAMDYKRATKLTSCWYVHKSNPGDYTEYARAEIWNKGKRKRLYLHRFVLNAKREDRVDHINGDGLNCTRKNLRFCSCSENAANRKSLQINNTSGYNGVFWEKRRQHWVAQLEHYGKKTYIGSFKDVKEAAKAYNKKAYEMFGEFARLNDV